jgi:hypothetical protein
MIKSIKFIVLKYARFTILRSILLLFLYSLECRVHRGNIVHTCTFFDKGAHLYYIIIYI